MATLLSTIITNARTTLQDPATGTPVFWTDAELLVLAIDGCRELWRSILDLYQDHFATMDVTNVSVVANTSALSGVPTDVFRVVMIQPRTLGSTSNPGLIFKPATLTDPRFVQAQAMTPQPVRNSVVYYAVLNAGAPVGAPSIIIAPQLSAAVPLALWYNPTLGTLTAASNNPVPGESDRAVTAYIIAWARAKEKADRSPDAEYISIYATEKRNLLTALTPRSIQEPQVADGFFESAGVNVDDMYDG